MLLLASTSDLVQVITSAAGQIDVHASYVDYNPSGSPPTPPGRLNTRISTATTTTVVAAAASGVVRNVKRLDVGNNHASVTNTVSLQHTDGTNVILIEQVTLAPLERMSFTEGVGIRVFDAVGREKIPTAPLPVGNSNTADISLPSVDTYLTGSNIPIATRLAAGSAVRWTIAATKTAAGTAAAIFNMRFGTAVSTADTARCALTFSAAQTAAADHGVFTVYATFSAVGASTVVRMNLWVAHLNAGFVTAGHFDQQVTSSAFDSTPAGTNIGLSVNPGASGVWTVQTVSVAALGLIG